MKTPSSALQPHVADPLFLALGQTLYACQLFEASLLEVAAHARELIGGTADGSKFFESIEALSRKTLGQLLHDLRTMVDFPPDIELRLIEGLDARNFVVHQFANSIAENDLTDEAAASEQQKSIYEKCAMVMASHDVALALLESIATLNSEKGAAVVSSLRKKAAALRQLESKSPPSPH